MSTSAGVLGGDGRAGLAGGTSADIGIVRDNIRGSKPVVGDIEAPVAAYRIGADRFVELIEKYGLQTVQDAYADLLDYSERLMRKSIAVLPDGNYSATTYLDGYLDHPDLLFCKCRSVR